MLRRLICGTGVAATLLGLSATSAAACGGLVARNGAVRLARATTMVAWHAGVEHYVTSFTYQGVADGVGWVVPLPAVPTSIVPAGKWTLQRLDREFTPVPQFAAAAGLSAGASRADSAEVLQTTTVEAVDITVLRGSAQQVIEWCRQNNFALNDETRAHIQSYAKASPIFMAARYDVNAARKLGRLQGDGTPVLITMPTPHLWVPLEVLANALDPVDADVYLVTDGRPTTGEEATLLGLPTNSVGDQLPGAPGFVLQQQEWMNQRLHQDLSSDRNMSWVPVNAWVTHLRLQAPSPSVTYDMSLNSDDVIRLASLGTAPGVAATQPPQSQFSPHAQLTAASLGAIGGIAAAALLLLVAALRVRARRRSVS